MRYVSSLLSEAYWGKSPDLTTLYFEADEGDGFREPGYSKERRLEPQVTLGVPTSARALLAHTW